MSSCFSSKVENIFTHKITQFFAIDLDLAFINWQSFEKSSTPIVDMFIGDYQSNRMNLGLREVQFLITDDFLRSKFAVKVEEDVCVWFLVKSFHYSVHVFF